MQLQHNVTFKNSCDKLSSSTRPSSRCHPRFPYNSCPYKSCPVLVVSVIWEPDMRARGEAGPDPEEVKEV